MQLECRYIFSLPEGSELLVKRQQGDSPVEWRFDTGGGATVVVEVPARQANDTQGAPMKIAWSQAEGWEVWALPRFRVNVLTKNELERPDPQLLESIRSAVQEKSDPIAIDAASRFLRTARWRTEQFWLPERLTLSSAVSTVEYYLDGKRIPLGLINLQASVAPVETALSQSSGQTVRKDLASHAEPALYETLLLDAMLYRSLGDYRVALVLAAISLEAALSKLLRSHLTQRDVATQSQIDKFLDNTSNRLLCTVMLGLLDIGDRSFRERCRQVFELRNRVMHATKKSASLQEASDAIGAVRELVSLSQGDQ